MCLYVRYWNNWIAVDSVCLFFTSISYRYGQPIENGYPAGMMPQEEVPHPDDRYRDQMDDSYRGPQDQGYPGPQDDSYRGPQDDSFRGPVPQDDRSIPIL